MSFRICGAEGGHPLSANGETRVAPCRPAKSSELTPEDPRKPRKPPGRPGARRRTAAVTTAKAETPGAVEKAPRLARPEASRDNGCRSALSDARSPPV